jgi:hypothetical protein
MHNENHLARFVVFALLLQIYDTVYSVTLAQQIHWRKRNSAVIPVAGSFGVSSGDVGRQVSD